MASDQVIFACRMNVTAICVTLDLSVLKEELQLRVPSC
jgi:hypothetical protein